MTSRVPTWADCIAAAGHHPEVLRRFVELFAERGGSRERFSLRSSQQAAYGALSQIASELDGYGHPDGPRDSRRETCRQAIAQITYFWRPSEAPEETPRERRARIVETSDDLPLTPRELAKRLGWDDARGRTIVAFIEERERVRRTQIWMRTPAGHRRVSISQLRFHCPELFTRTGRVSELHERFARYLPQIDELIERRVEQALQGLLDSLEARRLERMARQAAMQAQLEQIVADFTAKKSRKEKHAD